MEWESAQGQLSLSGWSRRGRRRERERQESLVSWDRYMHLHVGGGRGEEREGEDVEELEEGTEGSQL